MNNKTNPARKNKTIYIEDNKCYRIFESGYSKAEVFNEALNLARVEETGLKAPELFGVTMFEGKWAIIMEYVEGKNMKQLLEENPDKEDELLRRFVDLQLEVQSKSCPLMAKHRDKMNDKVSKTDLSATLRYDLHNRIEAMPRHNNLCHGDFNPSNVVIKDNGEAYIVDWGHATQGNVEADAARTFLMFLLGGERKRAGHYMDIYCEKSGCNYKDILSWIPILAASQSVKGIYVESEYLHSLIFMDEQELEALYEH